MGFPASLGNLDPPYPSQYQRKFLTKDNVLISIRPVKPDDAQLLVDFFNNLSPRTIYYRFLTYLKTLPSEWVERFTRIDYEQDVALLALTKPAPEETLLGVCRIMRKPGSTSGEVAVVVSDSWQGKGIGSALLEHSIRIAGELGMRTVWGLVSGDNEGALALAAKFGFHLRPSAEPYNKEVERTL